MLSKCFLKPRKRDVHSIVFKKKNVRFRSFLLTFETIVFPRTGLDLFHLPRGTYCPTIVVTTTYSFLGPFSPPLSLVPNMYFTAIPFLAGPPLLPCILGHGLPASVPCKRKPCERSCHCFIFIVSKEYCQFNAFTIEGGNLALGISKICS